MAQSSTIHMTVSGGDRDDDGGASLVSFSRAAAAEEDNSQLLQQHRQQPEMQDDDKEEDDENDIQSYADDQDSDEQDAGSCEVGQGEGMEEGNDNDEQHRAQSGSVATNSGGLRAGGPPPMTHFTIWESQDKDLAGLGGGGGGAGRGGRQTHKPLSRAIHRLGGRVYRASTTDGGEPYSFLYDTAAFLDPAAKNEQELYQKQHRHVGIISTAPPRTEWARLSYGSFSDSSSSSSIDIEKPWTVWGPSLPKGSSATIAETNAPVLDYYGMRERVKQERESGLRKRIEEVRGLLKIHMSAKTSAGAGAGAGAATVGGRNSSSSAMPLFTTHEELHKEALNLMSLKQQRELWSRLLGWKKGGREGGGGKGIEGWLSKLPEGIVVKQRTRRQSRTDVKKFQREQRKREMEREEARKKQLRSYLGKILGHREEFFRFHRAKRADTRNCGVAVRRYWEGKEKKVEREKESEERMRLMALRNNDMDEYIRLVETTRNERLNYLISQTDAYIVKIGALVQAERSGGEEEGGEEEEGGGEGCMGGMSAKARSYYALTHRKVEEVSQPGMLKGGELKEYQMAGLQWMISLYNNQLSGILADEMGLGKTIQSIALLTYIMENKRNLGPFLIVVPLSTLSNWVNEFSKWAPDVLLVQYKGTPDERKAIWKEEMGAGLFNVLLTTYDFVMKDKATLKKFTWEYIIVDEGHRMKNTESKFAQTLGAFYTSKRRLLLTGTPLQNSLPELWSLLNFLLPTIFSSPDTFDTWFNKPFASYGGGRMEEGGGEEGAQISEEEKMLIISRLHELLRPFMLRRVKSAVLGQLPTKTEKVLRCDLSGVQKRLYRQITTKALQRKKGGREGGMMTLSLNNIMMHLRKCCNHPFLFQDSYSINHSLVSVSGKLELLDRILPKLKAAGHRVLLFSQMTSMLDVLGDYFDWRGYRHLRLDGTTAADEREERMYRFNASDSPFFIFALSTRAGGLGLNLATADTVIFYDSDWNPSMDSQAMDRAHRIGQKNEVRVFRLITNTSVEERILSRANEKSKITNLVVEAGRFNKEGREGGVGKDGERRAMVESLLRDVQELEEEGGGEGGREEMGEEMALNEMMATSEDEFVLYQKMDKERAEREEEEWRGHLASKGLDPAKHPRPPRLAARLPVEEGGEDEGGNGEEEEEEEEEEKEEVMEEKEEKEEEMMFLARGRKRKEVSYADNMTEGQFMRVMEKRAVEEEAEKKKKRSKASAAAAAREGRKKALLALQPQVLEMMLKTFNLIRGLKEEDEEDVEEDVTDERREGGKKRQRQITAMFWEKPPKHEFADYYELIRQPIDLKTIRARIKGGKEGGVYGSLAAFAKDFRTLVSNACMYNEEGSEVYNDAMKISRVFEDEYVKLQAFAATLPPPIPPPLPLHVDGKGKERGEERGEEGGVEQKNVKKAKKDMKDGNGGIGRGGGVAKGRLTGIGGCMYDCGEF